MSREYTISYLEKRKEELAHWMSQIASFDDKKCLFDKYLKLSAALNVLKDEQKGK